MSGLLNLPCGCISFVKKTVPRQRCLLNCGWGGTLKKGEDGEKLRIHNGPGRQRPNKQGELGSLGRSKLLSFGKSRTMSKLSKTEWCHRICATSQTLKVVGLRVRKTHSGRTQ